MSDWKNGENGPQCFCGNPTKIMVDEKTGEVHLLCLFHTAMAGAIFPLPKQGRPDNWPNMTDEEMVALVDAGYEEQDSEPGVLQEVSLPKDNDQMDKDEKKLLN